MFNIDSVRQQFKALEQKVNNHPLVYLDSAATTLKPLSVVDRISHFYNYESSNVHRGAHFLSDQATQYFESSRKTIQKFIGASSADEIIFTKGTTEGINLVATCYAQTFLKAGDEIILTELEHHANMVPWQNLAEKNGLIIRYIPVLEDGSLDLIAYESLLSSKTKLVSFSGCSNILGTIPDIKKIVDAAHSVGAVTLLDAAQLISQQKIDVQLLGVDFLVFSAHKLFGPFGFGILYGRRQLLEQMPPYQFGGSMISKVTLEKTTYNDVPFKFEAGTPHIEGAIGTEAAIHFFNKYDVASVYQHEKDLYSAAVEQLQSIGGIRFFGTAEHKAAVLSFNIQGAHHSDVGQILDQYGVAVRVGHHCTQPLLQKYGLTGTVRASFSIYNNQEDVNKFCLAVEKAKRMLL